MPIERELKFRLPARAAPRVWKLLPGKPAVRRKQVDSVYYDTPERRLLAARSALRLRRDGRRHLIAFKHERAPASGLAQRDEWEAGVASAELELGALPLGRIRRRSGLDLRRLAPRLAPVFETRFTRMAAEVTLGSGTVVSVCLDRGSIAAGRRREALEELEIELREGSLDAMLAFAAKLVAPLRLRLEPRSKAERGYRLAARERSAPLKAEPPTLRRDDPAREGLAAVLRACLGQVEGNVPGLICFDDPGYLHQLRVGMRRLRAALRGFDGPGERKEFEARTAELKALMRGLGEARDWDVFCARIGPARAPGVARKARARRAAARRAARELVQSARFQKFVLEMLQGVEARAAGARRRRGPLVAEHAARTLQRLERKVMQRRAEGDWSDAARRHRLRIAVKRLRYACDGFASLYETRKFRIYLERLEALQDLLGELNDVAVARRLLGELRAGRDEVERLLRSWTRRERRLIAELDGAWRAWKKTRLPR